MGFFDSISRKLQGVDKFRRQRLDINAKQWVNTKPIDTNDLKGKVILITFASMKTDNKEVITQLNLWEQMFPKDIFQIISVYSPKDTVKEIEKTKLFLNKKGIRYPVALDNNSKTAEMFRIQFRPVFYLFDKRGRLRYRILDSKDLDRIGAAIMKLSSQK